MQLGWIDFSKTERSKILSVLELLNENGTLDELGISSIRDGYADVFFPGTSTIQTRAKYFMIIPYALKSLELGSESNANRLLKSLDEIERKCGESFLAEDATQTGVIGKRALNQGKWVKRSPADIYWAGLRRYNIFLGGRVSLSEYVRVICSYKTEKMNLNNLGNRNDAAEEHEADDIDAGQSTKYIFWNIPTYSKDWRDKMSMKLTLSEAKFLKEQIIESCPNTMLSYILKDKIVEVLDCRAFRDISQIIDKFPTNIQTEYFKAVSFSDFMFVIRTLYNDMVSGGKNKDASDIFEILKDEMTERASIDLEAIFQTLMIDKNDLKVFLRKAQELMLNGGINELEELIKSREIQLKGVNRAKTAHPGEFDTSEWFGGGELDYRFNNAKAIIRDIFESEGIIDAKSEQ